MNLRVTVFTPTYNRAYTLERLFISLTNQTYKNFEWIVVDDGSTDNTENLIENFLKKSNDFPIVYVKQENGGKHRAINRGVSLARGELFFTVDSDDYLLENAIEKLCLWVDNLDSSHKWAGVAGARGINSKQLIGKNGNGKNFIDASHTEKRKKQIIGDKAEAFFTSVLKKYPFPEFQGEKFLTESAVYNLIAIDGYYVRWYPDIIYICEYLPDGLTQKQKQLHRDNPQGAFESARVDLLAFKGNLYGRAAAVNRYYCAVEGKKTCKQVAKELGVSYIFLTLVVFTKKILSHH